VELLIQRFNEHVLAVDHLLAAHAFDCEHSFIATAAVNVFVFHKKLTPLQLLEAVAASEAFGMPRGVKGHQNAITDTQPTADAKRPENVVEIVFAVQLAILLGKRLARQVAPAVGAAAAVFMVSVAADVEVRTEQGLFARSAIRRHNGESQPTQKAPRAKGGPSRICTQQKRRAGCLMFFFFGPVSTVSSLSGRCLLRFFLLD
jgi:hypothetical protein